MAAAARVVESVTARGRSAEAAFAASLRDAPGAPEVPAVRAIALGTLRWYLRLSPALEQLVARPEALASPVRALLAVAAHQVEYSRNAPETSVDAAVDATRLLGMKRATGLVNAVLRRFVSERAAIFERIDASLSTRTAHPPWLVDEICAAWPRQAPELLVANNAHPPLTLRVDLSRTSAADYVAQLSERSIDAHLIQWAPTAVRLDRPVGVSDLPGFAEGLVSVQDAGAQLAAALLEASPAMRVLDACAAPGGKTGHLLEVLGEGAELTALDIDTARVALIAENLKRLSRTARLCVGDARDPASFWDGRPFERILIDAPCSSTGVIRRHPDIKLLRRPADVPAFAATQLALLRAAITMLSPGGRLLYSTCSVLPQENEQVVGALLASEPAMRPVALPAAERVPGAIERPLGVQLLPGAAAGTDGFYYACLEKTTTGA
ncbi:MAG TPA: 16S rRNA (cytosine(967)-C(5))-methyltransferase RsmB [Steroidobacteraceae bacterium]